MTSGKIYLPKWCGRGLLVFCLFIVLGTGVYGNSFNNQFHYDDADWITNNISIRYIRNIPRFFVDRSLSTNNPLNAGHYRPFVSASYAINYAIGGLNPAGYHLVNLTFHAGTAFLLFLIVKAMLESRLIGRRQKAEVRSKKQEARQEVRNGDVEFFVALAAGLIFLVHPFNSEVVNYITARSSVMSGFFYLLGFWCWINYRSKKLEVRSKISDEPVMSQGSQKRMKICCLSFVIPEVFNRESISPIETFGDDRNGFSDEQRQGFSNFLPLASYFYIFSLLAFLAGMLSKEVAVTLPVMLWLYDLYGFASVSSEQSAVSSKQIAGKSAHRSRLTANYLLSWRTYVPYLPFFIMVGIPYLIIWFPSLSAKASPRLWQRDLSTQLFTELPVLVKHWQMFLLPRGLSLIHDVKIYGSINWSVFISAILLLIYASLALYLIRSRQIQWRIVSFFMFWFFIVLLPTTLIPLNAIFQENRGYLAIVSFVVLAGIVLGGVGVFRYRVWVYIGGLVILVGIYSSVTFQRNSVWNNSLSLWKDAVAKAPRSGVSYAGLAMAYRDKGDIPLSIETALKGLSIEPDNSYLRRNLGRDYQLLGDIDRAIKEYSIVLRMDTRQISMWYDIVNLLIQKGDMQKAEQGLRIALKIDPDAAQLYYKLGVVFNNRGKLEEGVEAYKKAIALYPEYILARYDLAKTLERLGRYYEAGEQYRDILDNASRVSDPSIITLYDQDWSIVEKIVKEAREQAGRREKTTAQ